MSNDSNKSFLKILVDDADDADDAAGGGGADADGDGCDVCDGAAADGAADGCTVVDVVDDNALEKITDNIMHEFKFFCQHCFKEIDEISAPLTCGHFICNCMCEKWGVCPCDK